LVVGSPRACHTKLPAFTERPGGKIVEGAGKVGPRAASVSDMAEVEVEGKKATVQVKAIDGDKVTFEFTYPDGATEVAQMKRGESKTFIPNGKDFGVRIAVKETDS
jgi:hypothetical protein